MDAGRIMAAGKWTVVAGIALVGPGHALDARLAWVGVGVVVLGLAATTAGKLSTYGDLRVPRGQRAQVIAAWVALAAGVAALVTDYAYARAAAGYEGTFWPLLIAVAGLTAVYAGLRHKYVPAAGAETAPE